MTLQDTVPGGITQRFTRGMIAYSAAAGAHEIHGGIYEKYRELEGPCGALGLPTTDELGTRNRVGRFNKFTGGVIYWTPETGAHAVIG